MILAARRANGNINLVSEAERSGAMDIGRAREMRADRGQDEWIAGRGTRFRARNLFHGIDQERQPAVDFPSGSP